MDDKTITKKAVIVHALRRLFLQSKERAAALKKQKYTCQGCGIKKSAKKGAEVKVQVHHKKGILNWDLLVAEIRKYLLCNPEDLEVLCKKCHKEIEK